MKTLAEIAATLDNAIARTKRSIERARLCKADQSALFRNLESALESLDDAEHHAARIIGRVHGSASKAA